MSQITPIAPGLTGQALINAINKRLQLVPLAAASVGGAAASISSSQLILTVPGTIGKTSRAAPLV